MLARLQPGCQSLTPVQTSLQQQQLSSLQHSSWLEQQHRRRHAVASRYRPCMQQRHDPRKRGPATQRMPPQIPSGPPSLPTPPSRQSQQMPPPPPEPSWLSNPAQQGPISRRELFLIAGTAAGLVGIKIWQQGSDSNESEVGNRAGLPAAEMPTGRRGSSSTLRPAGSTAKRQGPQLNWLDGRLYVTSRDGATFTVFSTQEPGYVVLHSKQTDRWYSLPVELDYQVDTSNRSLMVMLFSEDWESVMREFKVNPKQ